MSTRWRPAPFLKTQNKESCTHVAQAVSGPCLDQTGIVSADFAARLRDVCSSSCLYLERVTLA